MDIVAKLTKADKAEYEQGLVIPRIQGEYLVNFKV